MTTITLYIIGNGFDLHHGIPSRYNDFALFLKATAPEVFGYVERYLGIDALLWSELEAHLADFDAEALSEDASVFLTSYGADDWSDSGNHDFQYEIDRVVVALPRGLKLEFAKWIRQLKIPNPTDIPSKLLRIDSRAAFLNFNYTPSLTRLYGVPESMVNHIHGYALQVNDEFVLGHGWNPKDKGSTNDGLDFERADIRVIEANEIIDRYFRETFKAIDQVIAAHRSFFDGLRETRRIFVMGHSLKDVDLPYFKEIIGYIDVGTVQWKVSYYCSDDNPRLRRQLEKLGVSVNLVEFATLAEF